MSPTKPLSESAGLAVSDVPHAPFVYFEEAPALGHMNGLIRVTLSAERTVLRDGKVMSDQVVTGYLRTNVQGARALLDALNAALLLAQPVEKPDGPAN